MGLRPALMLWLTLASWMPIACLDTGPSPKGRHLLASRDERIVELIATPGGAVARIVVSNRQSFDGQNGPGRIAVLDDPGPGKPPTAPRVIAENVERAEVTCAYPFPCHLTVDADGRIFVYNSAVSRSSTELLRVDLATGEQQPFPDVREFTIAPTGTRFAVLQGDEVSRPTWNVVGVDGGSSALPGGILSFTRGDVFILPIGDEEALLHLPVGSPTPSIVPVAPGIRSFTMFDTARGPVFLLHRQMTPDDVAASVTSLFDPATLVETALPPKPAGTVETESVPSPSGRYLFFSDAVFSDLASDGNTMRLYDRDTAAVKTEEGLPTSPSFLSHAAWRPGHDEVWFIIGDDIWRWPVDANPAVVATGGEAATFHVPAYYPLSAQEISLLDPPAFTPDGRFRIVASTTVNEKGPATLQSADDAAAPPVPLNPMGTGLGGLWPLGGDRFLVEAWIAMWNRNDIYLVDSAAGTRRALASGGHIVASGRDRLLALQHWQSSANTGDLTLIDYVNGTETLIAENVSFVAIDRSPVAEDALAPGTRVVYLVVNRIASPYDGCWAFDLP
jgi:hypothetical protein